jgi:hypothetical protein
MIFSRLTQFIVYYFKSISYPVMALFVSCNIIDGVALAITPSILKAWSEAGGSHTWFYMAMYALSSLLSFAATGSVIWSVIHPLTLCNKSLGSNIYFRSTLILIAPKAGKVLHYRLLTIIMRFEPYCPCKILRINTERTLQGTVVVFCRYRHRSNLESVSRAKNAHNILHLILSP